MEEMSFRRKFNKEDVEVLVFMLKESPLDVKNRSEMVSEFLRNLGYSADLKDIHELSSSVTKIPFENFRTGLEKIAREN